MQKKPGQISSGTLGLRFMQNAAKNRQEEEVEAAKAKVRSEEEWELSPDVKQSWGIGEREVEDQGQVTYEGSYLPFLFPAFLSTSAAPVASTSTHPEASEEEDKAMRDLLPITFKGRRTFGKHGKEEAQKPPPEPVQPPPSNNAISSLHHGARSISSHGRNAVSSSSSNAFKPKLSQHTKPPSLHAPFAQNPAPKTGAAGFMKPQVDAPREEARGRRKRLSCEAGASGDIERKKKKQRENESFNSTELGL